MIISRINGFTYVETEFDPYTEEVKVVYEKAYSNGPRADVKCYGADNVPEGVAIMKLENVGVSITGNSTNPTRFQHPVAGTYKKWCVENGVKYFSVASGGGTGRTLHPDNMAAGPSSYGLTDTMGRMHSDAQFAGSSSVPAHVEMMGLIGMGNNPMVGATGCLDNPYKFTLRDFMSRRDFFDASVLYYFLNHIQRKIDESVVLPVICH